MLPGLASQLEVYGAANAVVDDGLCIDPGVDDQAGAGLEVVCVAVLVGRIKCIEEGGGGRLGGRLARTGCRRRRGRVDGHARVVDETHDGGLGRLPVWKVGWPTMLVGRCNERRSGVVAARHWRVGDGERLAWGCVDTSFTHQQKA